MNGRTRSRCAGLCALSGIAAAFRSFYAVTIDGAAVYSSRWIVLLGGLLLALPAAGALVLLRRSCPEKSAAQALEYASGRWGARGLSLIYFAVLTYDAGALLRMMSAAARYVAMPESSGPAIMAVTAAGAWAVLQLGYEAAANAAILWKRAITVLIVLLIAAQMRHFRPAWLTPIIGAQPEILIRQTLPAGGILAFSAAGWLLMGFERDTQDSQVLWTTAKSGLIAAALAACVSMLTPGMVDELSGRSFRLGRLLANDRAGLSLEMPYVIVIYGCMLNALLFEAADTAGGPAKTACADPAFSHETSGIASGPIFSAVAL